MRWASLWKGGKGGGGGGGINILVGVDETDRGGREGDITVFIVWISYLWLYKIGKTIV